MVVLFVVDLCEVSVQHEVFAVQEDWIGCYVEEYLVEGVGSTVESLGVVGVGRLTWLNDLRRLKVIEGCWLDLFEMLDGEDRTQKKVGL